MNLIKFNNQPNFTDLLDNFFERNIHTAFDRKWGTMPATNILDKPEAFELEIAVPGMKKDDFKINLENNLLTISSKMEEEKEEDMKNYSRKEFNFCSFSRSFTLPKMVDSEKIGAEYTDGILRVNLPKKQEETAKPMKEIKVA
jgi:HSP20 family protein